jgi:FtsH-binding integral membrane protein
MTNMDYSQQLIIDETNKFFQKVYGWMSLGLIISGITAYWIGTDPVLYETILFNETIFYSLILGELALVS